MLVWEETKLVKLDDTMHFGNSYNFEGMEYLREEAQTPLGRFMIWPENLYRNKKWSLYGGREGWYQTGFKTKELVKKEVERFVNSILALEKENELV